ncbi:MAG: peptidoglycan-associated lipoprotein Pal [Pseudomonadota bacterium]
MKKIVFSALLASLLAACAAQEVKEAPKAAVEEKPVAKAETKPAEQKAVEVNPLKDPSNILSKRSVYYDFDKSVVKDEFKPMIEAHAKYLVGHKDAKVTLQGNCDERGSREYNLALGQRRAESVKKIMAVQGVPDARMETISFGKEKPRAEGHNEAAWAQNRRTDIVYQGE